MSTERIDALESLMRKAGHCARLSREFVKSFRLSHACLSGRQHAHHEWENLRRDIDQSIPTLRAKATSISLPHIDYNLYGVVEEANLDFLKPVRFRDYDFFTATEAAVTIAQSLIEDTNAITDWPHHTLTDEEHLEDCERLLKRWEPLTDDVLRDWALQVEIECRRAIRDEYEWLERQQAGEIPKGELRYFDKRAARKRLTRRLRNEHKVYGDNVKLAEIMNVHPEFLKLGLPPMTNTTVKNDLKTKSQRKRPG